jgi:hypothetical protein
MAVILKENQCWKGCRKLGTLLLVGMSNGTAAVKQFGSD